MVLLFREKESVAESFTLKCTISPFSAPLTVSDVPHLFVGLQGAPVRLEKIEVAGDSESIKQNPEINVFST